MSGIVGMVQFNGLPVEHQLLCKLTDFLAFRGPDAQRMQLISSHVGFGHTLFKSTDEAQRDFQPLTLDGRSWIIADARIDARPALIEALRAGGERDIAESGSTDAELILRAYRVWGTDCVGRLLGDFAFGVWDDPRQQLFCARDHMGVKPFYYAQKGSCVIFSNTLDCIRQHPDVSDRLNELAIGDFLLFGFNQDSATTSFAEIRRLPPAHRAIWSRNGLHVSRYWSMPIDDPIFYKRPDNYIDHFQDLLHKCVADRLRTNQLWIFMSGGIDSSTLAVTARNLMREQHRDFDLCALTKTSDLMPDEGEYAQRVARHLGIPIIYHHWTHVEDFAWERHRFALPEPSSEACLVPSERQFWRGLGNHSRVFFYGEGPDNGLHLEWWPYVRYLIKQQRYVRLFRDSVSTVFSQKRLPFFARISQRIRGIGSPASEPESNYPTWFNRNFESRLQLRERFRAQTLARMESHPLRPDAYRSLKNPAWQNIFESFDVGVTREHFEVRQPFVDVRMLRFLLAVPPLPWCRSKHLLRRAMRHSLPKEVLSRDKAGLGSRSLQIYLAHFCRSLFVPAAAIGEYINTDQFQILPLGDDVESNLRVRSLNHWLKNSYRLSDLHEGTFVVSSPGKPSKPPNQVPKKPYEMPRLKVYGDLQAITEAVFNRGNRDGGRVFPFIRTHA